VRPISRFRREGVGVQEYRNDFDAVGYGEVSSPAVVFNFLRLPPTVDTTKCRSPQNDKIGVFRRQRATKETDSDEIWHVNVHCGSALAR